MVIPDASEMLGDSHVLKRKGSFACWQVGGDPADADPLFVSTNGRFAASNTLAKSWLPRSARVLPSLCKESSCCCYSSFFAGTFKPRWGRYWHAILPWAPLVNVWYTGWLDPLSSRVPALLRQLCASKLNWCLCEALLLEQNYHPQCCQNVTTQLAHPSRHLQAASMTAPCCLLKGKKNIFILLCQNGIEGKTVPVHGVVSP